MTSVSASHIILTPTQPVGSRLLQRESNLGPPHQESLNGQTMVCSSGSELRFRVVLCFLAFGSTHLDLDLESGFRIYFYFKILISVIFFILFI